MKKFYESKCNEYFITKDGLVYSINKNTKKSKILKPHKDRYGYLKVNVNEKTMKIHRLVAIAYLDNKDLKEQVNHINGVKTDNRLENLEWATRSENTIHAYEHGLNNTVKKASRKISFEDAQNIRKEYSLGNTTQKELSTKYGLSISGINFIINKKKYKTA